MLFCFAEIYAHSPFVLNSEAYKRWFGVAEKDSTTVQDAFKEITNTRFFYEIEFQLTSATEYYITVDERYTP